MGTSMIKDWRSLLITTIVLVLAISISARPTNDEGPAATPPKDAAPAPSPPKEEAPAAPKDAGPPPGALAHPVVQVPEHVNEPKVMTGEQHPSGRIILCSFLIAIF